MHDLTGTKSQPYSLTSNIDMSLFNTFGCSTAESGLRSAFGDHSLGSRGRHGASLHVESEGEHAGVLRFAQLHSHSKMTALKFDEYQNLQR